MQIRQLDKRNASDVKKSKQRWFNVTEKAFPTNQYQGTVFRAPTKSIQFLLSGKGVSIILGVNYA
jgi:hypothetical protein